MGDYAPNYKPSEIWTPEREYSQPILDTLEEFKHKTFEEIAAGFPEVQESKSGLQYSVFTDEGFSLNEAMVFYCPFNNSIEDFEQMSAMFIWVSAQKAGVHDEQGRSLPLILMGAPGIDVDMKFNSEQEEKEAKKLFKKGDLEPLAKAHVRTAREMGYETLHHSGQSQGGEEAIDAIHVSYKMDIDSPTLVAGDVVTAKRESRIPLLGAAIKAKKFSGEAKHLKSAINYDKVPAFSDAHEWNQDYDPNRSRFIDENLSMISPVNLSLGWGFAKGSLDQRIARALEYQPNVFGTIVVSEAPMVHHQKAIGIGNKYGFKTILLQDENHTWAAKIPLIAEAVVSPHTTAIS